MIAEMEKKIKKWGQQELLLAQARKKHLSFVTDLTLSSFLFSIDLSYPLFQLSHLSCKNKITPHKSHTEGTNKIAKGDTVKWQCKL